MPEPVYRQHNPQESPYYQCVEDHFEIFEQVYEEWFERQYGFYRLYVGQVMLRYLDCGDLKNGFSRVRCEDCGHEYLGEICPLDIIPIIGHKIPAEDYRMMADTGDGVPLHMDIHLVASHNHGFFLIVFWKRNSYQLTELVVLWVEG